jgi:hypothetical protein
VAEIGPRQGSPSAAPPAQPTQIAVPIKLLRAALYPNRCSQEGNWCYEHDAQWWPCPQQQLRDRLPPESGHEGAPDA